MMESQSLTVAAPSFGQALVSPLVTQGSWSGQFLRALESMQPIPLLSLSEVCALRFSGGKVTVESSFLETLEISLLFSFLERGKNAQSIRTYGHDEKNILKVCTT